MEPKVFYKLEDSTLRLLFSFLQDERDISMTIIDHVRTTDRLRDQPDDAEECLLGSTIS